MRKHSVAEAACLAGHGIEGDAHAGDPIRQVSFLAARDIADMERLGVAVTPGAFAENVVLDGDLFERVEVGDTLDITDGPAFVVTQIGKDCHNDGCAIKRQTGTCVMPTRGVFARVTRGGMLRPGQQIVAMKAGTAAAQ